MGCACLCVCDFFYGALHTSAHKFFGNHHFQPLRSPFVKFDEFVMRENCTFPYRGDRQFKYCVCARVFLYSIIIFGKIVLEACSIRYWYIRLGGFDWFKFSRFREIELISNSKNYYYYDDQITMRVAWNLCWSRRELSISRAHMFDMFQEAYFLIMHP